jgi:hypothetical protein
MKAPLQAIVFLSCTLPLVAQADSSLLCQINQEVPTVLGMARNINPHALRLALQAYNCAIQQGIGRKSIVTLIDYSLPSTEKRMWVIDIKHQQILFNVLVAQGKYTGDLMARYFSNTPESKKSSIGLFVTQEPYYGHDGYSLRINGLEKGFNDKAEERDIVIHGAPYVSEAFARRMGRIGLSWGCPAVSKDVIRPLIDKIKEGSLVFSYYPDPNYLAQSKFLHCTAPAPSAQNKKPFFSSILQHFFSYAK